MPDQNSIAIMALIDSLSFDFRKLVHEYGVVIVTRMMADGYNDPDALRDVLETWRQRRQDKLLATE